MEPILKTIASEKMQKAFDISSTYSEVISRIGLSKRRQVYSALTEYIWENKIDLTQFFQNSKSRPKFNKGLTQEDIFKKDSMFSGSLLKKIKQYNLKDCSKCEICGISEWMGKPITFQVHHKDGDRTNNELDNLQILCPNCHSQTDNYKGRNRCKIQKEIKYCNICGKELSKTNTTGLCAVCLRKSYRNINRPDKDELLNLIIHNSFSKVAKLCNVSDRTIIKWLKQDKLPYTRKLINDYIKENNIDI